MAREEPNLLWKKNYFMEALSWPEKSLIYCEIKLFYGVTIMVREEPNLLWN